MSNLTTYNNESLYVRELMKNDKNKVFIWSGSVGPNKKGLEGFVDAEFSLSTNTSWGNEVAGSSFNDLGSSFTKSFSSERFKPQELSRVTWNDSSVNGISFEIYVPTITRGENNINMAKNVFDFTLSEKSNFAHGTVFTPNRYNVGFGGEQEGTLSVKIGNWFASYSSWVMTTASLTRSKESIPGSTEPLWVKVSCSLVPCQTFYATDVKGWYL